MPEGNFHCLILVGSAGGELDGSQAAGTYADVPGQLTGKKIAVTLHRTSLPCTAQHSTDVSP